MNKSLFFLYCVCLLFSSCSKADNCQATPVAYYSEEDKVIFARFQEAMEPERGLPTGDLMVRTACFFLDVPYVAATLENEPEGLTVNFRGLDCMTLVENTLALVQTMQNTDLSFDAFARQLYRIRYRADKERTELDYTDRLHYTTDWVYENEKAGRLHDVTREIGGKPLPVKLNFISSHPESYKQLKSSPERVARIKEKEQAINARSYYYIPKDEITACASGIQDGDIICFVTGIKGLDVSHMAVACRVGDELTFIHASTVAKKVIVNQESLATYAQKSKSNIGIMVVRPWKVIY